MLLRGGRSLLRALRHVRQARTYLARTAAGVQLPTLEDLYLKPGDDVAMSGGVDSSVTLRLLAELDLSLSVLFMRNWDPLLSETGAEDQPVTLSYGGAGPSGAPNMSPCGWEKDWSDVRRVCAHVGIPESEVKLVDLSREYWSRVFEPSVAVWDSGRTPNPDVWCNREIKFGALMEHIPDGHILATGHYARAVRTPGQPATLHRARDMNKDQTYYLSQVPSSQLQRAVFPLAGIPKPSVRELARHFDLPTAEREESMGVCFIGERGKFGDFVSQYTSPPMAGWFVNEAGEKIAEHKGSLHYTIGQRAGLGGMPGRWFVARKGVNGNDILLVPGSDHPALQCKSLTSNDFRWITAPPGSGIEALVQVRHRMAPVPATITVDEEEVNVKFKDTVAGVAEGQIVGVWDGDKCLGSGTISGTTCLDQL